MQTYRRSDILDAVGYSDEAFMMIGDPLLDILLWWQEELFYGKCQTDAYSFLNYGGRVYSLLPSFMSGYVAAKFYLWAGYYGYHCEATEDILR
jgi:hypothetical protein